MIVVTGAAGFIGSCLISYLNKEGYFDLVPVDDPSDEEKMKNLEGKQYTTFVHRDDFFDWFRENERRIQFVFHLGARTDTTEMDEEIFRTLNLDYSKKVWELCVEYALPLVYASSAATYGKGEHGFVDDHSIVERLEPLNPYGVSKNEFDKWALAQKEKPFYWAGLKFFNVYGPNEYHKGRMASVIWHAYQQIRETGKMRLFKSHHPDYADGEQLRDFIYVRDVVDICTHLMHQRRGPGLYNVGTGKARTFLDLTNAVFAALGKEPDIEFIPTPEDIRENYQYFTEADTDKLQAIGYSKPFTELEEGVRDYVRNYLEEGRYF